MNTIVETIMWTTIETIVENIVETIMWTTLETIVENIVEKIPGAFWVKNFCRNF